MTRNPHRLERQPVSTEHLLVDVAEGILTITLNRPETMNALSPAMRQQMMDAFDRSDADDSVRAVIVTGAGRGFCSGADLSGGSGSFIAPTEEGEEYRDGGGILSRRILASLKPVIGAINGAAVGMGVAMTLPMDWRIASDQARFGFVYTRRGIAPEGTGSWMLPRLVGIQQSLDWMLTGRIFGAVEALEGGLVGEVVEPDQVLPRAREIAAVIRDSTAPVSVAVTRQMLWRQLGHATVSEAHALESRVVPWLSSLADAAEGVRAFREKRSPEFTDRPSAVLDGDYPWAP